MASATWAGMSGWKSSATGRGNSAPDAELGAALSIGRSVTSGPFAIRTLATRSGGLRRIGSWTALTPGRGEFLCSGYVTGLGEGTAARPRRPITLTIAASAARASGTCARTMTAVMIGSMMVPSSRSRSSEPAAPPRRVSSRSPSSRSARWATRPASNDAATVTRMFRTSRTSTRWPPAGRRVRRNKT